MNIGVWLIHFMLMLIEKEFFCMEQLSFAKEFVAAVKEYCKRRKSDERG